jgi:hypothetical protein
MSAALYLPPSKFGSVGIKIAAIAIATSTKNGIADLNVILFIVIAFSVLKV